VRLVHRECLDRWRSLSPHPDAMTACELCKTNYRIICREEGGDRCNTLRYVAAVALDLTLFFSVFVGLYMLAGFLGDLSFTKLLQNILPHTNGTACQLKYMNFLCQEVFQGRIWFWGFIVFFFILGVVGSIFACCYRDDSGSMNHHYGHDSYSNNDCWWIWCGPSYYNGYYYYSPYGYWGPGDLMCWWCLMTDMHHHHHAAVGGCAGCGDCSCHDCGHCTDLSGCSSNDCGKEAMMMIVVVVIIIVIIFVIVGVVFGSIITFLLVNKVMKRHLTILEKQAYSKKYIVCDLDNPSEVQEAENSEGNLSEVFVASSTDESKQPLNKPPKGKDFDLY